jgi:hypothetical protein
MATETSPDAASADLQDKTKQAFIIDIPPDGPGSAGAGLATAVILPTVDRWDAAAEGLRWTPNVGQPEPRFKV